MDSGTYSYQRTSTTHVQTLHAWQLHTLSCGRNVIYRTVYLLCNEPLCLVCTCIGEEDLCDIVKELTCVAARWRNIGILLGIRASDLDAIRGDRPIDCLLAMLLIWLRKSYNVKRFGEPTWLKLVEVVSNKAGGENTSLAEDIARRYKCESYQKQYSIGIQSAP